MYSLSVGTFGGQRGPASTWPSEEVLLSVFFLIDQSVLANVIIPINRKLQRGSLCG